MNWEWNCHKLEKKKKLINNVYTEYVYEHEWKTRKINDNEIAKIGIKTNYNRKTT